MEPAIDVAIPQPSPHVPRSGAPHAPHGPGSATGIAVPVALPTANAERSRATLALPHERQVTPSELPTDVSSSKRASQAAQRYSKIGIGGTMRELVAAIQV
jgi:hypothetical protein